MFGEYTEKKQSRLHKLLVRAVTSLIAGVLLTVLVNAALRNAWPYLRATNPEVGRLILNVSNLPGTICYASSVPDYDRALACYFVGLFINPFYYAAVILILWYLKDITLKRKRRLNLR
ncbi:MAG TPA: hypothetical protein VF528_10915 [Pyrinomonadaceae bacterium]|jgi:hypothetical protein